MGLRLAPTLERYEKVLHYLGEFERRRYLLAHQEGLELAADHEATAQMHAFLSEVRASLREMLCWFDGDSD